MAINASSTTGVPLYATQGGGLAEMFEGQFVWVEPPDWMQNLPADDPNRAEVGDPVPSEWGIVRI